MDENWGVAVSAPLCCSDSTSCHLFNLFFVSSVALICTLHFSFCVQGFPEVQTPGAPSPKQKLFKTERQVWKLDLHGEKSRRGMVESWGDNLLFHIRDVVYISGKVWEVPKKFLYPEGWFFCTLTHCPRNTPIIWWHLHCNLKTMDQEVTNATEAPVGTNHEHQNSPSAGNCLQNKLSKPVQQLCHSYWEAMEYHSMMNSLHCSW